tara:strand:+ start:4679 stop:6052 length:1374 start_codon:yes stop_codon:yes gene_type:complete
MNYSEIINAVLYDLNETTIAESAAGLSGTRGVQTTIKKDVNRAIRDIESEYIQWPWQFNTASYTLFGGKGEYKYPVKIIVSSVSGAFTNNEYISGGTSSAKGIVRRVPPHGGHSDEQYVLVEPIEGEFQSSETLTGANSSVTATSGNITHTMDVDYDSFFLRPRNLIVEGEFDKTITLGSYWNTRTSDPAGTSTSGTPAISTDSSGNKNFAAGVLRLNAGCVDQAIPTIENKEYRITVRLSSGSSSATSETLNVFAGSSSDKDSDLSTTFQIANTGGGEIRTTKFTASTQNTFISFSNTASQNLDIDFIEVFDVDSTGKPLQYKTFEEYQSGHGKYHSSYRQNEFLALSSPNDGFGTPECVYRVRNDIAFGVTPIANKTQYEVLFNFFTSSAELSAYDDKPKIPSRYHDVIVAKVKYYVHQLRGNNEGTQFSLRDYETGVRRMKTELINQKDYMRAV